jgi:hypothetical protein
VCVCVCVYTHIYTCVCVRVCARARVCVCVCARARPPLYSSSQSSWLQIQRSGFDSRRYQIFCDVVGLERDPLSLVSTIEELRERNSSGSCLESLEYGLVIRHADHVAPSIRKS